MKNCLCFVTDRMTCWNFKREAFRRSYTCRLDGRGNLRIYKFHCLKLVSI